MEANQPTKYGAQVIRQLANLKIVSRLLAHELHAAATSKTVTFSKDEVTEIQTCIDLFIEEVSRRQSSATPADTTMVTARVN